MYIWGSWPSWAFFMLVIVCLIRVNYDVIHKLNRAYLAFWAVVLVVAFWAIYVANQVALFVLAATVVVTFVASALSYRQWQVARKLVAIFGEFRADNTRTELSSMAILAEAVFISTAIVAVGMGGILALLAIELKVI